MQALCAFSEKVHCPCTLWLGLVHNLSILSLSVHVVSAITNFMAQKLKFQNWSDICICSFYIHVWLTFIGYTSQVAFYRNSFIKYGPIDYEKSADVMSSMPHILLHVYIVQTCTRPYLYFIHVHASPTPLWQYGLHVQCISDAPIILLVIYFLPMGRIPEYTYLCNVIFPTYKYRYLTLIVIQEGCLSRHSSTSEL